MATKTLSCTADVSISQKYPGNAYNQYNRLAIGSGSDDSSDKYYALLNFSELGIPSANYRITSAVLTLTKISGALGFNANFSAKAVRIASSWSESTNWNSKPSTTTVGQSAAVSVGSGHSGSFSLDVTEIVKAWQSNTAYGIQIEKTTSGGSLIKCICDRTGSNPAYITVTYEQVLPSPTSPIIGTVGTITTQSKTFTWSKSTDTVFSQEQIAYELQVSANNGYSWSSTYTTSANASSYTVNVSSFLGINTSRYYYTDQFKVRIRAKTPAFNGTVYYSPWAEATGAVDYRKGISAPSFSLPDADIHEGGNLVITFSRPSTYNLYQANGSVNRITYTLRLGNGNAFASTTSDATNQSVSAVVTVPDITSGIADYSTTVYATASDSNGQSSVASSSSALVIRRHRAPVINVTSINREEASAAITFRVTDTGYENQSLSMMQTAIKYSIDGGAQVTVTPTWSWPNATFTISGLQSDNRYTVNIVASNIVNTDTAAKQTNYRFIIIELTPAAFVFRDDHGDTKGLATQTLIVGQDYSQDYLTPGKAYIEKGIHIPDLRNETITPELTFPPQSSNFYFYPYDMFGCYWWAVLHVRGWQEDDYSEYEIAGPASNQDSGLLAFRWGRNGVWHPWQKIAMEIEDNAGSHNAVYRGKALGSSVTAAQWAAIQAGTFADLYIGDYWTINGVNWRIAAFDYWAVNGSSFSHHAVIVPDTALATASMNSTNTTSGAYYNSNFRTGASGNTGRSTAISAINSAFGSSHIMTYTEYLHSAVTDGHPSGEEWANCTVELMTEEMVYGMKIMSPMGNGVMVPHNYTVGKSQLPLFSHDHSRITTGTRWWLRSVVNASDFALVMQTGGALDWGANDAMGIRPSFAIK